MSAGSHFDMGTTLERHARPRGNRRGAARRLHGLPVPRMGGVAIDSDRDAERASVPGSRSCKSRAGRWPTMHYSAKRGIIRSTSAIARRLTGRNEDRTAPRAHLGNVRFHRASHPTSVPNARCAATKSSTPAGPAAA